MIEVTGQGTASVTPDMATIQSGVVTQADSAVEATGLNSQVLETILSDLDSLEVDAKDIQTSHFSVHPIYDRGDRGQQRPDVVGYRVTNQLAIQVRDLEQIGDILDKLVYSGSNQMSGIHFGVEDPTATLNEARKNAIANARAKAELYAEAAGVSIGRVISISETSSRKPSPVRGQAMEMRAASVPVATGEQDYSATVHVTYELVTE